MGKKYTIAEFRELLGITEHALRFYEKEGLLTYVERTPSGRRLYGEACVARMKAVLFLKQIGISLPHIKEFLDASVEGLQTLPARLQMLREERKALLERLEELARGLALVNFAIDGAEKMLEARKRGEDPNAAFSFMQLEGIANYPFERRDNRWEPAMPDHIG